MTATTDAPVTGPLTPTTISRLAVPELEELQSPGVRGFFTSQLREEGLTSNWFRALSLNEGDLERLNGYLLPLLGTDGRGGLTAREREVIATVVSGENRCAYCHTNHANKDDHDILEGVSIAAFIGATNRIGIALAVPPNPEYTGIPAGQGRPSA